MVFRVTQIDEMAALPEHMAESLRIVELRLRIVSIDQSYLSIADLVLKSHRVFVDDNKTVVRRVRYDDQIVVKICLLLDAEDLARVSKVLLSCCMLLG